MIQGRALLIGGGAALVALLVGALWVRSRGGVGGAAQAVGGAAVDAVAGLASGAVQAAGGVASGAVSGASGAVGLPTPSQTVTDPRHARWLIDNAGLWQASKWSGVPALTKALTMQAGTGVRPGDDTAAGRAFAGVTAATEDNADEVRRLVSRYGTAPAGPESIYSGVMTRSPEEAW